MYSFRLECTDPLELTQKILTTSPSEDDNHLVFGYMWERYCGIRFCLCRYTIFTGVT
jgi:hypothetical protein